MTNFICKDCGQDFFTAKEFVYHIPECKPENLRLLFTQAVRGALAFSPSATQIANELLKQFRVVKL